MSQGKALVIMGVSGSGKSTVGVLLASSLNCKFIDADDYHSQTNKEKMKNGVPLSDDDRIPWLETLRDVLRTSLFNNQTVILGCSALQKSYREILRCADTNYEPGSYTCAVKFVMLDAKAEVISARLERRAAEGKHFMSATLLQSQMDLLEIDESERIMKVDATLNPKAIVDTIQDSITNHLFGLFFAAASSPLYPTSSGHDSLPPAGQSDIIVKLNSSFCDDLFKL